MTRLTSISRRDLLVGSASTAALLMAGPLRAAERPFKIGYVTPKTGPLSLFAAADAYILASIRHTLAGGIDVGGKTHPVEIIVKDSQSNPNRASEAANELVLGDEVDLVLVSSAPETVNPVSDVCELNGAPCISTVAPWQAWVFGRGGSPDKGFESTFHFFWGFEALIPVMTAMWDSIPNNRKVGGLFPNDVDGRAWGDPATGAPSLLKPAGYEIIPSGYFRVLSEDFSAVVAKFKSENCDILSGNPIPPDFTTFWAQARQAGFRPKIATIAKALLFPAALEALGDAGHNLSTEIWWSPGHPYRSSLTGHTAAALAADFTRTTKLQWTQPIGFAHALFEIAANVLTRSQGPGNREAVIAAIKDTALETIVGRVVWKNSPIRNVATTPLVGGQWRLTPEGPNKYDLVITTNVGATGIPTTGTFEELRYS
nr:ABC transporter substrate-binding protein [uncultured Gellertiella sp.]